MNCIQITPTGETVQNADFGELTYRYAHGEFEAEQYQHLLDGVVQKIVKDKTATSTYHNC